MRLQDKSCLISGGGKGLGAAQARLFASEGARVAIGDILEDEGRRVVAELAAAGGDALFVRLDVTVQDDWESAVQAVVSAFGGLDVLVNNAGIYQKATVQETSANDWDRVMAVNATGTFLGTKAAIPAMRRSGGGAIVELNDGTRMLTGVNSYGWDVETGEYYGCDVEGAGAAAARVDVALDWILPITGDVTCDFSSTPECPEGTTWNGEDCEEDPDEPTPDLEDTDSLTDDADVKVGCGCATGGGAAGSIMLALLSLLGLVRRQEG